MGRKNQSVFEDLIEITAHFPWWVGVILAIASYLILHSYASVDVIASSGIGHDISKQLYKTFATIGQYLLPTVFSIGAIVSFVKRERSIRMKTARVRTQLETYMPENKLDNNFEKLPSAEKFTELSHDSWSLSLIKSLEWKRFEDLCAGLFSAKGYKVEETSFGADGGIDIFLYKPGSDKPLGIIQCKAWNSKDVGVKEIRELFGVMQSEEVPFSVFMTTSDFTKDARDFAKGKHLKLLSGVEILNLIRELLEEKQKALLAEITKGDYTTPTCPSCGIKMKIRTSKQGSNKWSQFWGCANYPSCRQKMFL